MVYLMKINCFKGIILEYEQGGTLKTKSVDMLDLNKESNIDDIATKLAAREPLITESRVPQVQQLLTSI